MAAHIEQIAEDAFKMAKRTYSQLITLLKDNSTESYVQDLTEKWVTLFVIKPNLRFLEYWSLIAHFKCNVSIFVSKAGGDAAVEGESDAWG